MKAFTQRELISYLKDKGFVFLRHQKHPIFINGEITITLPNKKEPSKFTIDRILKKAGIKVQNE